MVFSSSRGLPNTSGGRRWTGMASAAVGFENEAHPSAAAAAMSSPPASSTRMHRPDRVPFMVVLLDSPIRASTQDPKPGPASAYMGGGGNGIGGIGGGGTGPAGGAAAGGLAGPASGGGAGAASAGLAG